MIEDCYNANPTSMRAALSSLLHRPVSGRRIAVLGTMRELGRSERRWHERVAEQTAGIDCVITISADARMYDKGFPSDVVWRNYASAKRATADFRFGREQPLLLSRGGREEPVEIPAGTGYDGEIRHLLRACAGTVEHLEPSIDEAAGLTRMLVAERESLIRSAPVSL